MGVIDRQSKKAAKVNGSRLCSCPAGGRSRHSHIFSKYTVELIQEEDPNMYAAAATLMALIGSGVSGYTNESPRSI